ncbi:MAG: FtsQ-type POTRA domain-containing protein [Archangium sp.]|nr:FtsQ-type POTRA domain-containing protein [Archangium sp.]
MFRSKKNRRRVDLAKKTGELKAAAQNHGPVALKLCALALGFIFIAVGGNEAWKWAHTARQFALADVRVSGQSESTDVELVRLGGVLLGQNLLAMDVRAMERSIATHPWVKSVSVTRRLPSHLTIEVVEHRAIATLTLGDLYLVNEEAEPFKRIKPGDAVDLPLVTGLDRDALTERREGALASLREALTLIDAYAAEPGVESQPLSEVNIHPEGITAVTATGQEIEFGEGDVLPKLGRLARVRKELHARSMVAEVIRLDNRTRPSWVAVQLAVKKP